MTDLLLGSPLLTIFLVVALGAIVGVIPFGPLRLGAAGALFVGLAIGNTVPDMADKMGMIQNLGLALFVYTVGLSAGQTFFSDLVRQSKLMIASIGVLIVGAFVTIFGGIALGFKPDFSVGIFAGSTTNTPALAAASAATGNEAPAVGYSLAYPMGVIFGIIFVALIVGRPWKGINDTESLAGKHLAAVTANVEKRCEIRRVPGWQEERIRMSYLRRGDDQRVVSPGEVLLPGDRVVIVGLEEDVTAAVDAVGTEVDEHLADDRSIVGFRSFVVSRKELAGRSIASLNLPAHFGAMITRVNRGDLELLAADDLRLELGDRIAIVYPRPEEEAIVNYFGNSQRKISEVDAIGLGLGLVAGLLLGMIQISTRRFIIQPWRCGRPATCWHDPWLPATHRPTRVATPVISEPHHPPTRLAPILSRCRYRLRSRLHQHRIYSSRRQGHRAGCSCRDRRRRPHRPCRKTTWPLRSTHRWSNGRYPRPASNFGFCILESKR